MTDFVSCHISRIWKVTLPAPFSLDGQPNQIWRFSTNDEKTQEIIHNFFIVLIIILLFWLLIELSTTMLPWTINIYFIIFLLYFGHIISWQGNCDDTQSYKLYSTFFFPSPCWRIEGVGWTSYFLRCKVEAPQSMNCIIFHLPLERRIDVNHVQLSQGLFKYSLIGNLILCNMWCSLIVSI